MKRLVSRRTLSLREPKNNKDVEKKKKKKQLTAKQAQHDFRRSRGQAGFSAHLDTHKINSIQACYITKTESPSCSQLEHQHSCFEPITSNTPGRRNKKLLNRGSDLLDVGLVVQNARKQGTVLLQWGLIGFYNNCRIQIKPHCNSTVPCFLAFCTTNPTSNKSLPR